MMARWTIGLAALAAVLASATPAGAARYPALFGTREVFSADLAPFVKWTGVLARLRGDPILAEGSCEAPALNRCHAREWRALVARLRGATPDTQLDAVNRFMNRAPYITDPRNYRVPDYWASVRQFFTRDGDCEDYAIAKFVTLRALGWKDADLRVVVLKDLNLKIAHAVLVAYRDGRAWMLDNQIDRVVDAATIRHYRPYYSINEEGWWLHKP